MIHFFIIKLLTIFCFINPLFAHQKFDIFIKRGSENDYGNLEIRNLLPIRELTGDTKILPNYNQDNNKYPPYGAKKNGKQWVASSVYTNAPSYADIWGKTIVSVMENYIDNTLNSYISDAVNAKNAYQSKQQECLTKPDDAVCKKEKTSAKNKYSKSRKNLNDAKNKLSDIKKTMATIIIEREKPDNNPGHKYMLDSVLAADDLIQEAFSTVTKGLEDASCSAN